MSAPASKFLTLFATAKLTVVSDGLTEPLGSVHCKRPALLIAPSTLCNHVCVPKRPQHTNNAQQLTEELEASS